MPIVLTESDFAPSPTTVGSLINEVLRYMRPGELGLLDRLPESVDADTDQIPLDFGDNAVYRGAWIAIGLEVMHVWNYDTTTKIATVERAMNGSNAVLHEAGSLIYLHPRFTRWDIATAIRSEIRSWPASLFALGTYDLALTGSSRSYDLPIEAFTRVLDLSFTDTAQSISSGFTTAAVNTFGYRVLQNQDTASWPSGNVIIFDGNMSTGTGRLLYAKAFSTTGWTETTTGAEIGLTVSMEDLPVIGAAARLMPAREIPRSDTQAQGQTRLAEEVPPNYILQTARELERLRDKRIAQEARRLREVFPYREA